MSRPGQMVRSPIGILFLTSMFSTWSLLSTGEEPKHTPPAAKFETPQKCFEAYLAALRERNSLKALSCKTPVAQNLDIGNGMVVLEFTGRHRPELFKKLTDISTKHGYIGVSMGLLMGHYEQQPEGRDFGVYVLGSLIQDKQAFLADVEKALGQDRRPPRSPRDLKLKDVRLDKDFATAVATSETLGPDQDFNLQFRKIDGSWLIAAEKQRELTYRPLKSTPEERQAIDTLRKDKRITCMLYGDFAGVPVHRFRASDETIKDNDLEPMRHLGAIAELDLSGSKITDKTLGYLKPIKGILDMSLEGTGISDAGLPELYGHAQLQRLDLRSTLVSQRGAEALRKKLPNCEIQSGHAIRWEPIWIGHELFMKFADRGKRAIVFVSDEKTASKQLETALSAPEIVQKFREARIKAFRLTSVEGRTLSDLVPGKDVPRVVLYGPDPGEPQVFSGENLTEKATKWILAATVPPKDSADKK